MPARLPIELVTSIIESAYFDDKLEPNRAFLSRCALVCRSWSVPAQKLLFQDVKLSSTSAFDSFRLAVDRSTEHGRMLAASTVRLHGALDGDQPNALSPYALARAASWCPNLYELSLSLYGSTTSARRGLKSSTFDDRTLTLLESLPIVAFQMNNWSDDRHATTQLLELWPSLKSLSIGGTHPPMSPPSSHSPFALEELRMNFPISPSLDFVKWLLHRSAGTLRRLGLERKPCSELLEHLLNSHADTLQSLVLPCISREHLVAVNNCRQLREIVIENARMSPDIYRKIHHPQESSPRQQLPGNSSSGSVEHMGFSISADMLMQPILEVIKLGSTTLKAVTVHVAGPNQHAMLPALQIACAYRGIDLRMTKDIRIFRAMINGDSILSHTFPRTKSLSNLTAMRLW